VARIELNLFGDSPVDLFIPQTRTAGTRKLFPVLWLLHDYGGNHADWLRYTRIELYAEEKGVMVVCPNSDNSYFVDTKGIADYVEQYGQPKAINTIIGSCQLACFISGWLRNFVFSMFPASRKPADNSIAGLGMGGYGALRLMLAKPGLYGTAISIFGELDAPNRYARGEFEHDNGQDLFGDAASTIGGPDDLFALVKNAARGSRIAVAADRGDTTALEFCTAARAAGCDMVRDDSLPAKSIAAMDQYVKFILGFVG
jgi:S-formylglutathione hydrolase FrmB